MTDMVDGIICRNMDEALEALEKNRFPIEIRPAYVPSSMFDFRITRNRTQYIKLVEHCLAASPISEIRIMQVVNQ